MQNTAAQGAVVTLGASITDGVASAQDDNRRWPNDLANRLSDGDFDPGRGGPGRLTRTRMAEMIRSPNKALTASTRHP